MVPKETLLLQKEPLKHAVPINLSGLFHVFQIYFFYHSNIDVEEKSWGLKMFWFCTQRWGDNENVSLPLMSSHCYYFNFFFCCCCCCRRLPSHLSPLPPLLHGELSSEPRRFFLSPTKRRAASHFQLVTLGVCLASTRLFCRRGKQADGEEDLPAVSSNVYSYWDYMCAFTYACVQITDFQLWNTFAEASLTLKIMNYSNL